MKSVNLSELSDQELMEEEKKRKKLLYFFRVIIGLLVITQIYNTINKGFSISILTPLCFVPILISTDKTYKAIQEKIEFRKSR